MDGRRVYSPLNHFYETSLNKPHSDPSWIVKPIPPLVAASREGLDTRMFVSLAIKSRGRNERQMSNAESATEHLSERRKDRGEDFPEKKIRSVCFASTCTNHECPF